MEASVSTALQVPWYPQASGENYTCSPVVEERKVNHHRPDIKILVPISDNKTARYGANREGGTSLPCGG